MCVVHCVQNPEQYRHPAEHGMPYENLYFTTEDGLKLHAWFIKGKDEEETKARPTILFFHANAGSKYIEIKRRTNTGGSYTHALATRPQAYT